MFQSHETIAKRWIIPDIHGCLKTVRGLFDHYITPSKEDELYFLGDYIDRGPDSKGVIDYLIGMQEQGFKVYFLKGNHEESAVEACRQEHERKGFMGLRRPNTARMAWRRFGGRESMKSFGIKDLRDMPQHYIDWMACLPTHFILDKYVLVHAGLNYEAEDPFSDSHSMLWLRDFGPRPERIGGRILIHGHVPLSLEEIFLMRDKPESFGHIDLDNGVYMAGREGYGNLVALELNSMELYSQYNLDM
ncbi:MAG: metallophosphoesterase family protein [Bacteroidales bacterium]|nr:metallophosphoesterase family protein [Bacteroidales bacterium]